MRERKGHREGGAIFGLLLVFFGSALLLQRLDVIDLYGLRDYWSYWPFLFVAWGLYRIISAESPRRVGGGVTTLLFGLWFLVSTWNWNGLDWSNSWPLVFVAIGAGMVTRGILERAWHPASGAEEVRHDGC